MTSIVNQVTALTVTAVIVEAVVYIIFSIQILKDFDKRVTWFPMTIVASIALGISICAKVQVDILSIFFQTQVSWFGVLVTGILVSRGSNYIHDILLKMGVKGK